MAPASVTFSERGIAVLFCAAFSGVVVAQDTDARLRAVEERLEQLDRRLDALDRSQKPASVACPSWDTLKVGMTETEVRRQVGEPAKIDASPVWRVWRFPACGNVHFDVDSRRVVGRSDP